MTFCAMEQGAPRQLLCLAMQEKHAHVEYASTDDLITSTLLRSLRLLQVARGLGARIYPRRIQDRVYELIVTQMNRM